MIHHRKTSKEIPTGGATVHIDDLCKNLSIHPRF